MVKGSQRTHVSREVLDLWTQGQRQRLASSWITPVALGGEDGPKSDAMRTMQQVDDCRNRQLCAGFAEPKIVRRQCRRKHK